MSVLDVFRNVKRLGKALRIMSLADLDELMDAQISGQKTFSGPLVSSETALHVSAFFNGVSQICQTIASLPLVLYERLANGGKHRFTDHPLFELLRNEPNREMDAFLYKESGESHCILWGNHYSFIEHDKFGHPTALWPFNPPTIKVTRSAEGELIYEHRVNGILKDRIPAYKILHVPAFGFDGRTGKSVLALARQSLGLSLATEEFGGRFFGQGANIGGILKTQKKLSDQAMQNLQESFAKSYASGPGTSHKFIVLEEDTEFIKTGIPPEDAQFLQTRVFQIQEVARWLNMPPHKLKEMSHATYSNIEHQQIEWVQDTIRPWLVRWEYAIMRKLLLPSERSRLFVEFLVNALLRGDTKARNETLHVMRQDGIINANQWLAIENMNPQEGEQGELYLVQLNMQDASKINQPAAPSKEKDPLAKKKRLTGAVHINVTAAITPAAVRSIKARRKLREAYLDPFRRAAAGIVATEVDAIKDIAESTLGARDLGDFRRDIGEWYRENRESIRAKIGAVYQSYGLDIHPLAAQEIGEDEEPTDEFHTEISKFTDNTTDRYIGSSRAQLISVARKAQEADGDPHEAVLTRLSEWEEKRPGKVADREVVDGESGLAQAVYFAAGLRCQWVAFGDSCPYCNSLNGKVIGRGDVFLQAGESIEPPDAVNGPLQVKNSVRHPRAHDGCDCGVTWSL